jgi:hypothetical protein
MDVRGVGRVGIPHSEFLIRHSFYLRPLARFRSRRAVRSLFIPKAAGEATNIDE